MQNSIAAIGIDFGATNIRAGLVKDGKIQSLKKRRLPEDKSVDSILSAMVEMIDSVDDGIKKVGIGVPSVVDSEKGIVYDVTNIPGWDEVPLKQQLEKETGKQVFINNDANCFALGEYYFGEGREKRNLIGLVIGTGFAGGAIIDGKIYEGRNCGAGEFGMIPYKNSILEHYCSGQFFSRQLGLIGEEVYKQALAGDRKAIKTFEVLGIHIAEAIKIVLYTFDPDSIVLGGGISKTFDIFKDAFYKGLETYGFPSSLKNIKITISKTEHVAVLGAAALTTD
ncbi:ROK family protein [Rhodohalobacter sulfatireducens]|uniref:ROK family protein n=1 Tax=Rhodohalobacter sulfatireducens TaxID=2911366 RepID=A0ABS9KE77_9BACT|nr:ROK family protein [Rhodohalobacter sulfatireducens]MCG2589130.1 ROK family protein [Rhodohalobacter sulfatireducens]